MKHSVKQIFRVTITKQSQKYGGLSRTYYPEDFNDFIESSEYIALIDMIASPGQSSVSADLNAPENFQKQQSAETVYYALPPC